ncbi:T6SS effector BTH_I2691 family protein [Cupriavidus sp. DL-D2]|uniref:T6SS effector BTH_I2691 family protein n=1 Tax=Cupriavidus sp. DL-D2 TaxID=3144974 RepID=UPI0032140CBD
MTKARINESSCPFCDKKGLPILPVRYAIGRTDRGNAPSLPAGFGEGVTAIKLPDTARYTLRLLRSGFLYTFDERRKEWRAYVVNGQSYLYEFDARAKAPPSTPILENMTFSDACKAKADPYKARCFTVKDAATATRIWIGFSDVAWTSDVLKDYTAAILGTSTKSDAAERKQSLQCIDIAAWRTGKGVPHMATFDGLNHVAEFVADGATLKRDTREYVKHFLPPPYTNPDDMRRTDETTTKAVELLSPMVRKLLPHDGFDKTPTEGLIDCAAWRFSAQPFWLTSKEMPSLIAWGNEQAKPLRPAMIGVLDPAGITIDLNGLAIQRAIEFTDVNPRRWMFETAQMIAGLRAEIGQGAVQVEKKSKIAGLRDLKNPDSLESWQLATVNLVRRGPAITAEEIESRALQQVDDNAAEITEKAWASKYKSCLKATHNNVEDWKAYLETYQSELEVFGKDILSPLDEAFTAWLAHRSITDVFKYHYDPKDLRSGASYLELALAMLTETSGRQKCSEWIEEQLEQDPQHANAWLMRSFGMNHDSLINAWKENALSDVENICGRKTLAPVDTRSLAAWFDAGEKLHDKLKDILIYAAGNPGGNRYFDKVARLTYEVSGPYIKRLSDGIDKGIKAALPVSMQMGLLRAVATAGNPNIVPVILRGEMSMSRATHMVAKPLRSIAGGNAHLNRAGVDQALNNAFPGRTDTFRYDGVVFLDKAKAAELLPGLKGVERSAAVSQVLTTEQFDAVAKESIGKIATLDVKLGLAQAVLSAVALRYAYREMMKATPADKWDRTANFAGGVVGLVGGMSAVVGGIFANTDWGRSPLSRPRLLAGGEAATRSGWLIGIGRILGTVGGMIGGALAISEGVKLYYGNYPLLGGALAISGVAIIAFPFFLIFFQVTGPVGLFFGLLITVVMVVLSGMKPDGVQEWLRKTIHFGKGPEVIFDNYLSQMMQFEALQEGK